MLELALALAIVTQDQVPLRGAAQENAPKHALLTAGDALEVRAEQGDWLQVWDHRRERGGYVRATQTRRLLPGKEGAARQKILVEFLADQPGRETLGIGYAAAFLAAVPEGDADVYEAVGKMADRLVWRATRATRAAGKETALRLSEAHLESAKSYGVAVYSVESADQMTLCYDGAAWQALLGRPEASLEQKARAALALTRFECVPPTPSPSARLAEDEARATRLEAVLAEGQQTGSLSPLWQARLQLRAAGVWATLAHERARQLQPDAQAVQTAGQKALSRFMAVDGSVLKDADARAWQETAIRVGTSRWSQSAPEFPVADGKAKNAKNRPSLQAQPGQPGQTCLSLQEGGKEALRACTYGQVWPASLTLSPDGRMLTLAVQPLPTWRELWVFQKTEKGWTQEALPPAAEAQAGYLEFAGWVPGNQKMLVARETIVNGYPKTRFELWDRATLKVEKQAERPEHLTPFYRWQDPAWKAGTVAVR
ncbi:MAG: hypothetical protein LBL69_05835 [Zoogloeaceae bacterium]|jgi:hypothetical protein|nr:hypothetical protein [Zoogloeaceae bacterium]